MNNQKGVNVKKEIRKEEVREMINPPCDYCRRNEAVKSVEDGNVFLCQSCWEDEMTQITRDWNQR